MSADAMPRFMDTSNFFFGNRAGICAGAIGCHAFQIVFQIVVSQTRLADDVTRHRADRNCVRVVLGMGAKLIAMSVVISILITAITFCALVVAHSVRAASILHQQPVEPLGEFGPSARLRPRRGLSLALLLSLVAPAPFLAEFLGRLAFDRQPDQVGERRRARPLLHAQRP